MDSGQKKTKSQLKAERRAKQEAQRIAKAAGQKADPPAGATSTSAVDSSPQQPSTSASTTSKPSQEEIERLRKEKADRKKQSDKGEQLKATGNQPSTKGNVQQTENLKGGQLQQSEKSKGCQPQSDKLKGGQSRLVKLKGGPQQKEKSKSDEQHHRSSTPAKISTSHSIETTAGPPRVTSDVRMDDPAQQKKVTKSLGRHRLEPRPVEQRRVALFQHLPQYDKRVNVIKGMKGEIIVVTSQSLSQHYRCRLGSGSSIHPSFLELGVRMDEGLISGSNARCLDFLRAMIILIRDYKQPDNLDFGRHFNQVLQRHIAFLTQCRPLAVTMRTAILNLKEEINRIDKSCSESESKEQLIGSIEEFVKVRIEMAGLAITNKAMDIFTSGDLVLVYGYSSLVVRVLTTTARERRIKFRVLVVDSQPTLEGRAMVSKLTSAGIPCLYTLISAVPTYMPQVSLVVMGAHALLSNGYVVSRIGAGYVANVAAAFHKPLFVCCETYKFWERAQTDAFEYNELCDPDQLFKSSMTSSRSCLADWRDSTKCLYPLCLANDIISHDLAQVLVSDEGIISTRSVPVVMRVKRVGVV